MTAKWLYTVCEHVRVEVAEIEGLAGAWAFEIAKSVKLWENKTE